MSGIKPKVAICGAGAMGSGIAQVAAQAGCEVAVFDVQPAALADGEARTIAAIEGLVARGKMDAAAGQAVLARFRWTDDLATLADADLVIEAIIEDAAIKADLFAGIEAIVGPEAIIASNTSSLPISRLARGLAKPERFVGMHFFNPAPVMKLVEVVSGAATSPDVAEAVRSVATAWGKVAIPVADVPGFIVNRVARPFYAEAFVATAEGVAPATVDALIRAAGFRMGPLELADLIGHDVNFAVASSVHASYFGRTRFVPQIGQAALVDAGWFGRKTGRGVYRYDGGAPAAAREEDAFGVPSVAQQHAAQEFRAGTPGGRFECDGIVMGTTAGATARAEALSRGRPVALFDWFAAEGTGPVGFAASEPAAVECAQSVLAALGRHGRVVADRPGLVVMRTLAQLANAAADAVFERVSDEAGIDAALRYGANYPFGPLAWADRIGRRQLVTLLDAIATETGEAMYRPSLYLRQSA